MKYASCYKNLASGDCIEVEVKNQTNYWVRKSNPYILPKDRHRMLFTVQLEKNQKPEYEFAGAIWSLGPDVFENYVTRVIKKIR